MDTQYKTILFIQEERATIQNRVETSENVKNHEHRHKIWYRNGTVVDHTLGSLSKQRSRRTYGGSEFDSQYPQLNCTPTCLNKLRVSERLSVIVDDSVKVLVKYDELFAVCFQSMGICFIGERNFEDFILEVRK